MHSSRTWLRALSVVACAAFLLPGCKQDEGEVCNVQEDCAEDLICCGNRFDSDRGIVLRQGICQATCMDVPTDAGPGEDAGPGVDAGAEEDAGADAGPEDAGADAGPEDAGTDAGPEDAGTDAGPMDAGMDAGVDGG